MTCTSLSVESGEETTFWLMQVPCQLSEKILPSKYDPSSMLLDFSDHTRTSIFKLRSRCTRSIFAVATNITAWDNPLLSKTRQMAPTKSFVHLSHLESLVYQANHKSSDQKTRFSFFSGKLNCDPSWV